MSFNLEHYHGLQKQCPEACIVVVTKYQDVPTTQAVIDAGIKNIAEAKIQDAIKKKEELVGSYTYHLIGHLQSNKVKQAVEIFDMIQSVDSLTLLQKIQKEAEKQKKHINILLQAMFTGEKQKYGLHLDEIKYAIEQAQQDPYVHLQGCMTMGKQNDDIVTRIAFQSLAHICEQYELPVCSMGMSHDWQVAYAYGSTMLRIGSMFFTT